MNNRQNPIFMIFVVIICVILFNAVYTIDQTEQVIITWFGKPVGNAIKEPGLHFKLPFLHTVISFDNRLLEWDGDPNRIPTKDKKYIWIDTTARWRIKDPLKYYQAVHDEYQAQSRLDDVLDNAPRNVIANHNLIEVVRSTNRILSLEMSEEEKMMGRKYDAIAEGTGRDFIRQEMLERAKKEVEEYGIELVDIRIKRINYEPKVRGKVFERMISERKRAAELLRAEGLGEQAEIEGKKLRELERINSEAYRKAQSIRGKADAEAINIYAAAYSKDPDFYSFLNTLKSYRSTFDKETVVLFSTESEYFKYMKQMNVE